MNVPVSMRRLVERRRTYRQPAINWPVDRWSDALPAQRVFSRLPKMLGREHVRHACEGATSSKPRAVDAFLAAMAWG